MQKEKVISTKVLVRSKNGIVYFPVRLPANAKKIVAVEYGVRMESSFPVQTTPTDFVSTFQVKPARHIGNLRLEHPGCSGLFYATSVKEPDSLIAFGDFSTVAELRPWGFTHGFPRYEDRVEIPVQARTLQGIYQDRLGNKNYSLLLHIWIETLTPDAV